LNKMKKINLYLAIIALIIVLSEKVMAHCPLCTIGAAAAAGGAVWLGVSKIVVSFFIGAFAVSMGWWFGRIIKKKYIPFQKTLIIIASFLLTVLPIMPLISTISPLYIGWLGEYGKTYAVNMGLVGSIAGGLVVTVSPAISKKLSSIRGKKMPFQGVVVTLLLLLIGGLIIQLII